MDDKPLPRPVATRLTLRFSEITGGDVPIVGGKNASLGEMYRELRPLGIPVPNGFAVTAEAYRQVLERAGAWEKLREVLAGLKPGVADLATRCARARDIERAIAELEKKLLEGGGSGRLRLSRLRRRGGIPQRQRRRRDVGPQADHEAAEADEEQPEGTQERQQVVAAAAVGVGESAHAHKLAWRRLAHLE